MDEQSLIRNGIGASIEQLPATTQQHRLWAQGWMATLVRHGFRNLDMLSADRVDFSHTASVELEQNVNATGCATCIRGECTRPAHTTNDPTYVEIKWTAITYGNFDHTKGDRK